MFIAFRRVKRLSAAIVFFSGVRVAVPDDLGDLGNRKQDKGEQNLYTVRSVTRAVSVLRAFTANRPDQALAEVAATAGLDKGTTRRLLVTLREAGLGQRTVGCYVLVGQEGDSLAAATARLEWVFRIGATPYAMYFRPEHDLRGKIPAPWHGLVRRWTRPAIIYGREKKIDAPLFAESKENGG